MIRPDSLTQYNQLDLKLGIKSSLSNVKSVLALAILLWECSEQQSELAYSEKKDDFLIIEKKLKLKVIDYMSEICKVEKIDTNDLIFKINENQLFKSQMESLIVVFELVWKLAKVSFIEEGKPLSSERTGGNRYPKKLIYSTIVDIIHSIIESNPDKYLRILMSWIGFQVDIDNGCENNLIHLLVVLSEGAVFKLVDGDHDVIFNQDSLYRKILETNSSVDINGDKEPKGSLRILKSLITNKLNPYLECTDGSVNVISGKIEELRAYQTRVDTFLCLNATKVVQSEKNLDISADKTRIKFNTGLESKFHRNRILFGAPGTGKSFTLNKERKELLGDDNDIDYERVTFHPDYSYANFIGTYKPVPCKDSDGKDVITYEYVPGPFMRIYVEALKNGRTDDVKPFLLIIEEINRANVAAVFGDIFQLLDRDDAEVSEYPIQASEDIKKYLMRELKVSEEQCKKIKIPDNMFIWATMNSADQGVFPMDTAFKRRWDFTYLGINDSEKDLIGKTVVLGEGDRKHQVEWNKLRKAINRFLAKNNVNEDKQLGPYFIPKKIAVPTNGNEINRETFINTFKNKVLMYLFEDAAKQKRSLLFEGCIDNSSYYSEICTEFEIKGIGIFSSEIQRATEPTELPKVVEGNTIDESEE